LRQDTERRRAVAAWSKLSCFGLPTQGGLRGF
jgi:hypothetical protein